MSQKSQRIAELIRSLQGQNFDAHYLGYFECFNQQLFFEAHDVLEELWLAERGRPKDLFYKGLIQLAGAFVHIQKQRPKPALALFKLAADNLGRYPATYESLDLVRIQRLISVWTTALKHNLVASELPRPWPKLLLGAG